MSSMLCMPSPSEAYIYICVQYCTVISHKALSIYKLVLTSYEWDASVMGQTIKNGVDGIMHVAGQPNIDSHVSCRYGCSGVIDEKCV